jgi:hypothetical protein
MGLVKMDLLAIIEKLNNGTTGAAEPGHECPG